MQPIEAILFEPVGCLAEFPAEPFCEMIARLFGRKKPRTQSASRAYWHLLNLADAEGRSLDDALDLEMEAAAAAQIYPDISALDELKEMGVKLIVASSLSSAAVTRLLGDRFTEVWTRDNSGGIKAAPLRKAMRPNAIFLTDTEEGMKTAKAAGVDPVLMMNDPDEARRLALHGPAGGIVSLHELPDFVRLLSAQFHVD